MKILAVGRNYAGHIKELNNQATEDPVIFMKPDTALLKGNAPFYLPDFSKEIHYEAELVLKIGKEGKNIAEKFALKYIEAIGVGIDFTARDLQNKLKEKGLPWELAKGFNGSAPVSEFKDISQFPDLKNISFSLKKNGELKQKGNSADMIHSFEKIISFISNYITLKKGDLIFTGTPEGVGKTDIGDKLEVFLEEEKMLETEIK
jgi:acylpyruvate hydrolase